MFFVEQVLVRGLHVLAGSFWFGAAVVMAAFLSPAAPANPVRRSCACSTARRASRYSPTSPR